MKVLLINPEFPDTYWSFRHALPFEGKRCAFPPLGLLTVSAFIAIAKIFAKDSLTKALNVGSVIMSSL